MTTIVSYRIQNRLDTIEALDVVLDNYWATLPENIEGREPVHLTRGWFKYVKGGIALLENLFMEKQVSDEEASRRADICIQCPHNIFPDRKGFLRWTDTIAEAATGGRKISKSPQLGNCSICSCCLKAKVFYAGELDLSKEEISKLPSFCWQLPTLEKANA